LRSPCAALGRASLVFHGSPEKRGPVGHNSNSSSRTERRHRCRLPSRTMMMASLPHSLRREAGAHGIDKAGFKRKRDPSTKNVQSGRAWSSVRRRCVGSQASLTAAARPSGPSRRQST
jgi:hypothetical protein